MHNYLTNAMTQPNVPRPPDYPVPKPDEPSPAWPPDYPVPEPDKPPPGRPPDFPVPGPDVPTPVPEDPDMPVEPVTFPSVYDADKQLSAKRYI